MFVNPNSIRKYVTWVGTRLNKPLLMSDTRAIKDGLLDYIAFNELDPKDVTPSIELMQNVLGYIICESDDWAHLLKPDINL